MRFTNGTSAFIQCRSCGVASPDFILPGEPSGISDADRVPSDSNQVNAMIDGMISALTHERTAQHLQKTLAKVHGDVALISYHYVPVVTTACAVVAGRYGFVGSTEGVKESLRYAQRFAAVGDDGVLTEKLIRLRRVFAPTGAWIREDTEAEADDQKRKKEEQEQVLKKQQEAERMQRIAEENAAQARLRAKKIALGLDPSVPRLPLLESSPPATLMTYADREVSLRVVARYTQEFQWHFNGKPIANDPALGEIYRGTQRSTLLIKRLTRRTVGEYFCTCSNEEGTTSSPVTQVLVVALSSRGIGSRKVKTLSPQVAVPLNSTSSSSARKLPVMVGVCTAETVLLLRVQSLTPVKTVPGISLAHASTALAWLPETKMCAVATGDKHAGGVSEISLYSLELAPPTDTTKGQKAPSKRNLSSSQANSPHPPAAPPPAVLTRHQATHKVECTVKALFFLDQGRLLAVSDLHVVIHIFELNPSFRRVRTLQFDPLHPISHITAIRQDLLPSHTVSAYRGLVVCTRDCAQVDLIHSKAGTTATLRYPLPVHRTTVDPRGFTIAAAGCGGIKSKIFIRSISERQVGIPPRQFVAHVGKVSGIQWTNKSMLLATSGYDGYIKLWDLEAAASPTCLWSLHLDTRGVHSFSIVDDGDPASTTHPVLLAVGFTDYRLHARELVRLGAFETTRNVELDATAARIQKIWKGRRTRDIINQFIKPKYK